MKQGMLFLSCLLSGCVSSWVVPSDFTYNIVRSGRYDIVTYHRISDNTSPVHIYIEGDGNSFDAYGRPTSDPTPTGTFVRDLAARDTSPNVAYIARPCQYIKSSQCDVSDWTDGRFSENVISAMSDTVRYIADNRPVVLIGYSGGAMISGLIIQNNPDLSVKQWITIAGVLNHSDWSSYFEDAPLSRSLNMNALPQISQLHYIAYGDRVVPNGLSERWVDDADLVVVTDATHDYFPNLNLQFDF